MLQLQKERYGADGKFIFRQEMERMLPDLRGEHDWLAEAPASSLQRVVRNLDRSLRASFKSKSGFPKFKSRFGRRSFYVNNQQVTVRGSRVSLPKIGAVRFRAGMHPSGKLLNATVSLKGDKWYCVIIAEQPIHVDLCQIAARTVLGVDAGLKELAVVSDGQRASIPKEEKRLSAKLRRLQKEVARRKRGSANREKSRRRLAKASDALANVRRDCRHKLTRSLVNRASVLVVEDLSVKGMLRGLRIGKSVSAAGMGEMRKMIEYKSAWAGKTVIVADRFFPSTQTCSSCGQIKSGSGKLRLSNRIYKCDCGNTIDRDLNAAMNLRRYGLDALGVIDDSEFGSTGQAMPIFLAQPGVACGGSSVGPPACAGGRHGPVKQESAGACAPVEWPRHRRA